jgi:hypothetical protein
MESLFLSIRLLENQGITGQLIFNIGLIAEYQDIHITELGYSMTHEIPQKLSVTSLSIMRLYYMALHYSVGYRFNYYIYWSVGIVRLRTKATEFVCFAGFYYHF